jgi:hypothetical protein
MFVCIKKIYGQKIHVIPNSILKYIRQTEWHALISNFLINQ